MFPSPSDLPPDESLVRVSKVRSSEYVPKEQMSHGLVLFLPQRPEVLTVVSLSGPLTVRSSGGRSRGKPIKRSTSRLQNKGVTESLEDPSPKPETRH